MEEILKDIAIGLAVLFLVFAAVVTAVLEAAGRVLGWRSANLWTWVRNAVDQSVKPDAGAGLWLFGVRATGIREVNSNAKKVETAVRNLLVIPKKRLANIPSRDFARSVVVGLLGDPSGSSAFDEAVTRVSGWSDNIPLKDPLLRVLQEAEGRREIVVDRLGDWFDEEMSRLAALYRRNMRLLAFALGLALALGLNLNALDAVDVLYRDSALRSAGVRAGDSIVRDCRQDDPGAFRDCAGKQAETFFNSKKLVEPGGLFDSDDQGRRFQKNFWPPIGIALAGGAIMLGAPFWLDALKRLTSRRST